MNAEFYETELNNEDALFDLFIDQLHQFAELALEDDLTAPSGSVAQLDRATAF